MITLISDALVIAKRDIIRVFRQKSQFYSSIVRPIIWLFLLGTGIRGSLNSLPGGFSYTQYIFPGILVMNVLFASIMTGTSIIWDREFGFLKEIIVAPVYRASIALGKTIGGSITSTLQGAIVIAFFPLIGLKLSFLQIILIIISLFLISLAICSISILIASRMKSFEGFGTVNNFIVMPLFFLSGAMYSIDKIPDWLKVLVYIDPVTYGVNLLRGIVLDLPTNYLLCIGIFFIFIFIFLSLSIMVFSREGQ